MLCFVQFSSVQFIKPRTHISPQCLVKKSYICIRVERINNMSAPSTVIFFSTFANCKPDDYWCTEESLTYFHCPISYEPIIEWSIRCSFILGCHRISFMHMRICARVSIYSGVHVCVLLLPYSSSTPSTLHICKHIWIELYACALKTKLTQIL